MFEGLVRQLVVGYLGQFIKDIQKEQLKITLWNGEVLLENVELILEAFDYLQLPFALKHGQVGKLSIKIPWKKLGWDPIIIVLEDVFISASQRENMEWSTDAVERRKFAGKKAKLAAAELAKVSRRVCDNRAGKSFVSYITAKILDGIQVSIKNFHVQYRDMLNTSAVTDFGVKLSGLSVCPQNLISSISGVKPRGGRVNKAVEVQGLELYCYTFTGTRHLMNMDNGDATGSKYELNLGEEGNKNCHILAPLDVVVSLSVNRSGKLETGTPQYHITAECSCVAVSMDEVQLQQILILSDYLTICRLRDRYGPYRPWLSPLEKKFKGWQIAWWHYAQESVLHDVREKLKKTSWKYFGDRVSCRRRYANLYKRKLEHGRQNQVIDENLLRELEEIEKTTDIDDILFYRSAAEDELQDLLINSPFNPGSIINAEKFSEDENPSSKLRGWLNWLSHGMLGAGGTDDSKEFSGVVTDDVIKDIYEATKFHPVTSLNEDAATNDEIFLVHIKLSIHQISAILGSKRLGPAIARLLLHRMSLESKIWEGSAVIIAELDAAEISNPLNEQIILSTVKVNTQENKAESQLPSLSAQVDVMPAFHEVRTSLKVIIQPIEMTYDSRFIIDIVQFFHIFGSFKFQHKRVLSSLDAFDDVQTRIMSKIDYILSFRAKLALDVTCVGVIVVMPCTDEHFREHKVVLEVGTLSFQSKDKNINPCNLHNGSDHHLKDYLRSSFTNHLILGFQFEDLYDIFEIGITDFEVRMAKPDSSELIPLFKTFACSTCFERCLVSDARILKAFSVNISMTSICLNFSASIYGFLYELVTNICNLGWSSVDSDLDTATLLPIGAKTSEVFWFSVKVNVKRLSFELDLENEMDNPYYLGLFLENAVVSFDPNELLDSWVCMDAFKITSYLKKNEATEYIIASSEDNPSAELLHQEKSIIMPGNQKDCFHVKESNCHRCLELHYETCSDQEIFCHKISIFLTNFEIHCYPVIVSHVVVFFDKMYEHVFPASTEVGTISDIQDSFSRPDFDLQRFGFSNFIETGESELENIPIDHFPFVYGPLISPQNSFDSTNPKWRKTLKSRAQKICGHVSGLRRGESSHHTPLVKSRREEDPLKKTLHILQSVLAEVNLSNLSLHFHDSSGVVGVLSLAVGKSLFSCCGHSFDFLVSSEGTVLSSSWWCQTSNIPLWGPCSPYLPSILNVRARKGPTDPMELSFGVQHVSCTLYPEFLAAVIGYFSSSDWRFIAAEQSNIPESPDHNNPEENSSIVYKFEILDSILKTPAITDCQQVLKLDIQQLVGSFSAVSDKNSALKDIPFNCLVPASRFSNCNNCLDLFGRNLSLFLVMDGHDASDSFSTTEIQARQNVTLIAPFSADVWVRFPIQSDFSTTCSVYPACIMASIINCQLDVGGAWTLLGYKALVSVINQFSVVDRDSKLFNSSVLEFLQLKARLDGDAILPLEDTSSGAMEIRLCVSSISIKLLCSKLESIVSEVIGEIDMQFTCSASLDDDKPFSFDVSISRLALFSLLNSVNLLEGVLPGSSPSIIGMTFSLLDERENKILLSLPCLDIWLHMIDWTHIVDNFYVQFMKPSEISFSRDNPPSKNEEVDSSQGSTQRLKTCSSPSPEYEKDEPGHFAVKLENVCLTAYLPVQFTNDVICLLEEPQVQNKKNLWDSCNVTDGNHSGFLAIFLESKYSEIINNGRKMVININLEKVEGTMLLYNGSTPRTWSPVHLCNITFRSEILIHQMELAHAKVDGYCGDVDLNLSNDIMALLRCLCYEAPESVTSKPAFGHFDFQIKFGTFSLVLTDRKWSSSGALLQIFVTNLLVSCAITESEMEGSVGADLQANYNNIDKVLWEPLVEPWKFLFCLKRKHGNGSLLNGEIMTHIHLQSMGQLNLNITESAIEAVSRILEIVSYVQHSQGVNSLSNSVKSLDSQISRSLDTRGNAPYVLHNLTSLPLVYYVCNGEPSYDDLNAFPSRGYCLQPDFSVPIFAGESNGKEILQNMHGRSSDKLSAKEIAQTSCCFIIVQLEGTSAPSTPILMDLVGLRYFEVDFSKSVNKSVTGKDVEFKGNKSAEGVGKEVTKSGFLIPVVIDVSVQGYTKLLRLYSTVILSNLTPVPIELRFDIPFGVSPKILDPIYPGKEFPLPLHLAESGRMRWRPLGETYLWSEAFNISNILSEEVGISLLRSFICYPSNPSSDPFRCCVSVEDRNLSNVFNMKKSYPEDQSVVSSPRSCKEPLQHMELSRRCLHLVAFSSPLVLKNYLPEAVSVAIESSGVTRRACLSKVETAFFHVDSSHDMTITFSIRRFRDSVLKFSRAEIFSGMAKFSGTKFSLSETLTFESTSTDGPLFVTMEKVMDAFSGAREICISVPFFIYNCIGFPLIVSNYVHGIERHNCTIPSCYHVDGQGQVNDGKDGLSLLLSNPNLHKASFDPPVMLSKNPTAMTIDDSKYPSVPINSHPEKCELNSRMFSMSTLKDESNSQPTIKTDLNLADFMAIDCRMADPFMYSPSQSCSSDIIIRLSKGPSNNLIKSIPSTLWSNPISLVPPTGSIDSVIVPHPSLKSGHLISVCAAALLFNGRTRIVTFQPRYVISNACSRDFFYKQKGTDRVHLLEAGQHSHIQCADAARELLLCIRFRDAGWQWSGCFSPEHLGDTQVKIRNYISGAVSMMCVEVQSADISVEADRVVRSPGNSATNLIMISDDETGFMPYRIDNFTKEKLRVYQQRCENFETLIHSYTSHCYSWDEPCFSHRLTLEVPGECVIGSFTLDSVMEYPPVFLHATSEKPERKLLVSVHSEGAIKVLSVIDCSCHVLADLSSSGAPFLHKRKHAQKSESCVDYSERILIDIPFIGVSLINSNPEELLFACAKNVKIDLLQSLDQQKLSLQISFLQIDNQLPNTPHPVIFSFDRDNKSHRDDKRKITNMIQFNSDGLLEPVFSLAVAKWRSRSSLVSLEYISLRVTDFHLELDQEVILSLFEFSKAVSVRLDTRASPSIDPAFLKHNLVYVHPREFFKSEWSQSYSNGTALFHEDCSQSSLLPSVIPIGAPCQQIHLLARRNKKIYVELLDLAPIKFSLSFSSSPWMLRNGIFTSGDSFIHRGLMALADVEGAQIHLNELVIAHQLGSLESIQDILIRHYTRQSLHEMYKVFGSAGLIGNPMAFARSVSTGIRDFLSAPARNVFRSPAGLLTGMAQGTSSLFSNTVYALSDAATQFSRVAHKGIVAFALDEQTHGPVEKQQKGKSSHTKGVINEFLEGLTGLLQSPLQGAEKSGLPGVLSGVALGVTRLVAKPAASILEVTGKTAQSIKNRSKLPYWGSHSLRVRIPRLLSRELPLKPYSLEEAVGTSVLRDADSNLNLVDEKLIICRTLKHGGRFLIITRRLVLVVSCSSLVDLGKPDFQGVPADPKWHFEANIELDRIIHVTNDENVVHIVGSSADVLSGQNRKQQKPGMRSVGKWQNNSHTPLPLFQTNLEFADKEEAEDLLQLLLSMVSNAKDQARNRPYLLHQINLR